MSSALYEVAMNPETTFQELQRIVEGRWPGVAGQQAMVVAMRAIITRRTETGKERDRALVGVLKVASKECRALEHICYEAAGEIVRSPTANNLCLARVVIHCERLRFQALERMSANGLTAIQKMITAPFTSSERPTLPTTIRKT